MKLILLTKEEEFEGEIELLHHIAETDVYTIHLRKPNWSIEQQTLFLECCSSFLLEKLVVHQFPEHAAQLGLKGWHRNQANEFAETKHGKPISANWHLQNPEPYTDCEYALCSPIFRSITKENYGPESKYELNMMHAKCLTWENMTRKQDGSSQPVKIALSGITPKKVPDAYMLGFDGVAVMGYVWQSEYPMDAVENMLSACNPSEIVE